MLINRRVALAGLAGCALNSGLALAQSAKRLADLKAAGVVRIGLANDPPYSGLNVDGTVTGLAPTLVEAVFRKLGVGKVEGIVAPYGQLIPGLQAGRWDMIGTSLTITKARCAEVLYGDPITYDGGIMAYVPGVPAAVPQSFADIVAMKTRVGILAGSYLGRKLQELGVPASSIAQFPDNPSMIDGLMARRVEVVASTLSSTRQIQRARNNAFSTVYPIPEDLPRGSSVAFRRVDAELFEDFQRELRAMKTSGEFKAIAGRSGFEPQQEMLDLTAAQACERAA